VRGNNNLVIEVPSVLRKRATGGGGYLNLGVEFLTGVMEGVAVRNIKGVGAEIVFELC
jgi:hypothetical protein